ncbi:hypothetical protein OAL10_10045 [Gammaproteobacteria bacterium]|nr:hypothetical protein [Gammaproteobacteria bacterium]
MEIRQQGNQEVLTKIADTTRVMRGPGTGAGQHIISAAQQMMKGVNPEKFLDIASKMAPSTAREKLVPDEAEPVMVNLDTISIYLGCKASHFFPL